MSPGLTVANSTVLKTTSDWFTINFIIKFLQSLSTFRIEANMYKAKSSDESIGVAEALRYLRATKFNSSKAIDIFKNYHVSGNSVNHLH